MKSVVVLMLSLAAVQSIEIGDAPIYEGRLSWADQGFEFRGCNKDEIYFVDASFSIQDTLDRFLQSHSTVNANSIYIRFHGNVIEGVDGLPDRYADVVRITDLLSYNATSPARCK